MFHRRDTSIILVILYVVLIASCDEHKHRVKRKVIFSKNSKLFFRLNGKDNVIPWVQIFAQGWAIRVNWDLPDTLHRRHKFFKRDVHSEIDNIAGTPGLEGYSCILNYICHQAAMVAMSQNCGIFCAIGRIINASTGVDADFFKSLVSRCDYYESVCKSQK